MLEDKQRPLISWKTLAFSLSCTHTQKRTTITQKRTKEAKFSRLLKKASQQPVGVLRHAHLLYEPCQIVYSGTVIHVSLHHIHLSVSRKKRREADISTQMKRQGQIGKEELARCRLSFWSGVDGHARQSTCPSRHPTGYMLLSCNSGEASPVRESKLSS